MRTIPGNRAIPVQQTPNAKSRNLLAACLAHALHDGYTDALYAFLPVWQADFGLSYAGLAAVRALYSGTMGAFQIPAERVVQKSSARAALFLATIIAAAGYLIVALPLGFSGLCLGLIIAGIGSSIQHPRGALLVHDSYPNASRRPLGVYNFSGDIGKAVFAAFAAVLLPVVAWRPIMGLMALVGFIVSGALLQLAPTASSEPSKSPDLASEQGAAGFSLLVAVGGFDTATRMGYLLFLPFLVRQSGGATTTIGLALALLFIGGAFGKATCGWLGQRLGVVGSVIVTEIATALLICATLLAPLALMLALLPFLGLVLNGTSSVLYGTVPELAPKGRTGQAFAIFYTSVSGSGGLAPIAFGAVADHLGQTIGILATAATAMFIVPLVLVLGAFMRRSEQPFPNQLPD